MEHKLLCDSNSNPIILIVESDSDENASPKPSDFVGASDAKARNQGQLNNRKNVVDGVNKRDECMEGLPQYNYVLKKTKNGGIAVQKKADPTNATENFLLVNNGKEKIHFITSDPLPGDLDGEEPGTVQCVQILGNTNSKPVRRQVKIVDECETDFDDDMEFIEQLYPLIDMDTGEEEDKEDQDVVFVREYQLTIYAAKRLRRKRKKPLKPVTGAKRRRMGAISVLGGNHVMLPGYKPTKSGLEWDHPYALPSTCEMPSTSYTIAAVSAPRATNANDDFVFKVPYPVGPRKAVDKRAKATAVKARPKLKPKPKTTAPRGRKPSAVEALDPPPPPMLDLSRILYRETLRFARLAHHNLHYVLLYVHGVKMYNRMIGRVNSASCLPDNLVKAGDLLTDACALYCITNNVLGEDLAMYLSALGELDDVELFLTNVIIECEDHEAAIAAATDATEDDVDFPDSKM